MKQPIALLVAIFLWLPEIHSSADESASEGRPAADNSSGASSTTMGQVQNAVAEENGVILLVTAPERWAIAEEFHVRVLLINQTRRPVVSILVDDWYDLKPAMVDEDGRSVPLTEYGRRKLGKREIFHRRILGVMEPGNFLSWNVDLSKAFKPEPGILELSLTVKYRFRDSDLASGLNSLKIDGISIEAVSGLASLTEGEGGRHLGQKGEMNFAALKREYAGRIDARVRGPARVEVMRALGNLMQEWNPVGHSREEVISLMGSPTHESDKELVYIFDSGRGGPAWRFHLESNLVVRVEPFSVN